MRQCASLLSEGNVMPELRWSLLIIGVLFIAVLAWWERRRPHQASRRDAHGEPRPIVYNDPSWGPDLEPANPRALSSPREPTLTLPEIRTEVRTREAIPTRELPVVEIPDEIEPEEAISEKLLSEELEEISEEISEDATEDPAAELAQEEFGDGLEQDEPSMTAEKPPEKPPELPAPILKVERPIVDWPPEDQRKLVSLRLVARPPERFRGNLVRQALSAEGFVLGDLDIFHKPDAQNRAVLSAASLTKPGTFDLDTMDTQRFVGLNLFAVLPGPKTPRKTFEELLLTARTLNERLEGALQDDRGGPLTPMRIQALRDSLETEAKP
jgi:cell division protein ZipA